MKLKLHSIVIGIIQIVFIIVIMSCKINKKKEKEVLLKFMVENCLKQKIILPNNLRTFAPFTNYIADSLELLNANLKIFSYINASCPTCIQDIMLWEGIIHDLYKYNVPVLLICASTDSFELIQYLHEIDYIKHFSYPLFFDIKDEYLKKNEFMETSDHFKTVLTDKENNILLLGNPLHSKEIKEMYLNEIQKIVKEYNH